MQSRVIIGILLLVIILGTLIVTWIGNAARSTDSQNTVISQPTALPEETFDLILDGTQRVSFETATRVSLNYNATAGEQISLKLTASELIPPPVTIVITFPDDTLTNVPNIGGKRNEVCGYTPLEDAQYTFNFDAEPEITYTVNFESGNTCEEE